MAIESQTISPWSNSHGKSTFNAYGRVKMDTAGDNTTATQTVTVTGAKVNDLVLATIDTDDTGASITITNAYISDTDEMKIVRSDDASCNDDAYISYLIIRP